MVVESTAEQVLKLNTGVSIITVTIFKRILPLTILPILFFRKMPRYLTGNSASTRGNNRQIDIRGMGPKNTQVVLD